MRIRTKQTLILAGFFLGFLALRYSGGTLFPQRIEVTVLDMNDIPRTCHAFGRRTYNDLACGQVYTDLGLFGIRSSSPIPALFMDREEIVDILRVGCRYSVSISALRSLPNPEARASNHIENHIYWATPIGDCAAL